MEVTQQQKFVGRISQAVLAEQRTSLNHYTASNLEFMKERKL